MCVCIYMYVYLHVCMYAALILWLTCVNVYMCVNVCICVTYLCAYIYVCMPIIPIVYLCTCKCVYVYMPVCIVHMCTGTCFVYTYMCAYAYMYEWLCMLCVNKCMCTVPYVHVYILEHIRLSIHSRHYYTLQRKPIMTANITHNTIRAAPHTVPGIMNNSIKHLWDMQFKKEII